MVRKQKNMVIAAIFISGLSLYWYFNLRGEHYYDSYNPHDIQLRDDYLTYRFNNRSCRYWLQQSSTASKIYKCTNKWPKCYDQLKAHTKKSFLCAESWCASRGVMVPPRLQGKEGHMYSPQWCVPTCALPNKNGVFDYKIFDLGMCAGNTGASGWYSPNRTPPAWKWHPFTDTDKGDKMCRVDVHGQWICPT
jgi:hypothetical protein